MIRPIKYLILGLSILISSQVMAQTDLKKAVDSMSYIFIAETANPLAGNRQILTASYDLIVTSENVVAFLPYFGRATSAPLDLSEAGVKFDSKDFQYNVTPAKKGGWNVIIKPIGVRAASSLSLRIFDNGRAVLQVRGNFRDIIAYNGYVKPYTKELPK